MNTISGGPTSNFQPISPYAPLGKPAVGLESSENKDHILPPVEEGSEAEKSRDQTHPKTDAVAADTQNGGDKSDAENSEPTEDEQLPARADEAAHQAVNGVVGAPSFRFVTGPDNQAAEGVTPVAGKAALDRFSEAAGQLLRPGALLDQHS